ncbi:hypothetical protein GCM10009795_041540 [Nocardioides hankookensis]|uniref:Excreted virulence factor EspC (Type VII ESX diderm) n=1 Tax=Nocardioides hankookensis TaxID=443157 RepID=A0ABW1LP05_9ACTN
MEAVPLAMGRTARSWDEQHLDLEAAAGQLGAAPTGGFTTGVAGAAARFASTWQRHVSELGETAETRADGLRTSATDYLQTDTAVASDQLLLGLQVKEVR